MSESSYQQHALEGASGGELVVALYNGAIRFLHRAMQCVDEDDTPGRRVAVKKVIDILMYLQARLRPDVGGSAATALTDFYTAMFTLTLEASHYASKEQFEEVLGYIRNVRDAWIVVAKDPATGKILPRELRTREEKFLPMRAAEAVSEQAGGSRWSA